MNPLGVHMVKSMASNSISNAKNSVMGSMKGNPNSQINWDDFNYPPYIRLIHFDIEELQGPQRAIMLKLHLSLRILMLVFAINFFNSIAQAIGDRRFAGRILYSILNIVLFSPFALYSFYKGYRAVTFDISNLKLYRITQAILILLYLIFSIIGNGCFNGWFRVAFLFHFGFVFQGMLGIVESMIYILNALLMGFMIYVINNYTSKASTSDSDEANQA